jgi:peptidoglycan/LPS O-acetylase OafA/YrhL
MTRFLQENELLNSRPTQEADAKYRPDIDGLRAIAVLLVLIFHGGLSLFPSGFIGVDIFFVISGYLITSIITQSIDAGNFSFAKFYTRRLWRLQPAMIALLLATSVLAAIFYLPTDFMDFLRSAKYTTLITSNQFFERTTTGYAVPDTAQLLLLHTWSLSIEWQWYLVLPLGIWLLHTYLPSTARTFMVPGLAIAFLITALALSNLYPSKSYYFFLSRIFEFLIGASVIYLGADKYLFNARLSLILGLTSLAAIFYIATLNNILLGFPDAHAILVVLATALLLAVSANPSSVSARLLSFRPLVFIGTISYSLYLWHWPIFAAGHYLNLDTHTGFTAICYALTVAVSYASYVTIERRLRRTQMGLSKTLILLFVLPIALFIALSTMANSREGIPSRFGKELTSVLSELKQSEAKYRQSCLSSTSDGTDSHCHVGDIIAPTKALLIGDSFSNQYWSFMDVLGKQANIDVTVQGTSSCLALPDIYLFDWWNFKNRVYQQCHDNVKNYYDLVKTKRYKYVVIGQLWNNYTEDNVILNPGDPRSIDLSRSRIESAFSTAINTIVDSGSIPVILKSTFIMPDRFVECFYSHIKLRRKLAPGECGSGPWAGDGQEWFSTLFVQFKALYPTLIVLDPKDVQCTAGSCMTDIDGVPVYRDVGHITDFASDWFGRKYLKTFGNPLTP